MLISLILRLLTILGALILLANIGFEILPLLPDSVPDVVSTVYRVNLQCALDERIYKDVLVLAYRPEAEHPQALSELQVTLPSFEKAQAGLQNGDASLMLPTHRPADVQLLLQQSQPDYAAIDTAARSILTEKDPVDANELAIVEQHERPYFLAMNTVAKVWQEHIVDNALTFFSIELGIGITLLLLGIADRVLRRMAK